MKKVLIITYYWPPSGGPGVQRILKFVKYLPEFGWQPYILTPKYGEFPAIDNSLTNEIHTDCEIIKTNIVEPGTIYKLITGMKKSEAIPIAVLAETDSLTFSKKVTRWLRANIFIPDAKIGWIPFALNKGKKLIQQHKIDIIFSSSPPPTTHLIAQKLARQHGIKWVADFRDPWTDIHYYKNLPRLKITQAFDKKLERSVLTSANWITSVSKTYINNYKSKVSHNRFSFLPNGFDAKDLKDIDFNVYPDKFRISSMGTINNERNPETLFQTVNKIISTNAEFAKHLEIHLIGIIAPGVNADIVKYGLEKYVKKTNYLPHIEALKKMADAWILLLPINNVINDLGILTGKLFEYIGSGKTILGFGNPMVDAASIVREVNAGEFFEYGDVDGTEKFLLRQFQLWKNGKLEKNKNQALLMKYERKRITESLVNIFENCL